MHSHEARPEQTGDDEYRPEDEERPVHWHSSRSGKSVQGVRAARHLDTANALDAGADIPKV